MRIYCLDLSNFPRLTRQTSDQSVLRSCETPSCAASQISSTHKTRCCRYVPGRIMQEHGLHRTLNLLRKSTRDVSLPECGVTLQEMFTTVEHLFGSDLTPRPHVCGYFLNFLFKNIFSLSSRTHWPHFQTISSTRNRKLSGDDKPHT